MQPFESLLPYLTDRVEDFGRTAQGGQFARFDNDLYFHPLRIPSYFFIPNVLQLRFYLFANSDGTHARPAFGILETLLTPSFGYDVTTPGGIGGNRQIRTQLRLLRDMQGWGRPSIANWRVKDSHPLPPGTPRCWAEIFFLVLPRQKNGPEGYKWAELGPRILGSLEPILRVLGMSLPQAEDFHLDPR